MKGFRESTRGGSSKLQLQQCLCADPLCRRGHHPSILPYHTSKREPFLISRVTGLRFRRPQRASRRGPLPGLSRTFGWPLCEGPWPGEASWAASPGCTGKPPGSPGAPGNLPLQSYLGTPGGGPGPTAQRGVPSTAKCSKSLSYAITYTMTILKKVQSIHYS